MNGALDDDPTSPGQVRPVRPSVTGLDATLDHCWRAFAAGAGDANSPWRLAVLATTDPGADASGEWSGPDLRTVILRHADREARLLTFHTDIRSAKVRGLRHAGLASWLFYDPLSRVQIRARSRVGLHHDDPQAREAWERVPAAARWLYAGAQPPGTRIEAASDKALPDEEAYLNFLVVACELCSLDWLELGEEAHERARFDWDGRRWRGAVITP
jgi:hypothetical protein